MHMYLHLYLYMYLYVSTYLRDGDLLGAHRHCHILLFVLAEPLPMVARPQWIQPAQALALTQHSVELDVQCPRILDSIP